MPESDKDSPPSSTAPVATPAKRDKRSHTLKVLALIVPALLVGMFMFEPTLKELLRGKPSDEPAPVRNANAFRECWEPVIRKKSDEKVKRKLDFAPAKTAEERLSAIENADLTPDERKSVIEGCKSMFPDAAGNEATARLTLVEGERQDPVKKDVRVAIEGAARYVEPDASGEAIVAYYPNTCGKRGCAVTIEKRAAYELVTDPSLFDKEALQRGATVKLRRKDASLAISLGTRAGTPHVWIEGTNADATLWNPSCQPNDAELPCRRVQAQDGIATLKTRGTLTSLTLRLSRDGDDWTAPPIAIDDVASQIRNGILSLPDAPAPAAAAACASEGPWLKQRLQQFKGWKSSRLLNITAVVSASGVDFGRNAALDADEKTALASFVRPPPSAKPGCRATPVTANGLHARVQ